MTSDERKQIEQLFKQAAALPVEDRETFLHAECNDDEVRARVNELLEYDQVEGGGLTDAKETGPAPTQDVRQSLPGRGDVPLNVRSAGTSSSITHGRFLPGTVLAERYRIVGLLGQGGMGEVYRADDLEVGQSVALKFLPNRLVEDPRSLERFRGEVRLARQVSHPNVCRVYDIGQINGQWFLSMQYVDGEDLAQLLKRIGRFPQERAIELARQLCMGLHAAHEQGVLHRDLKPANVMIDGRGKLLVTDFGLAEFADDVRGEDIRSGTPAYMAPEQLAGREVTVRSDIYSLGILLHEIYTGCTVWEASSMAELVEKRKGTATPPTPSDHLADLDPIAEKTIERCLEPDPGSRPASALEVVACLPGGDPLQAALAAGETPSPQMLANSSQDGQFSLPAGLIRFVGLCAALVWLVASSQIFEQFDFGELHRNQPEVLNRMAEEHLETLGLRLSTADYSTPVDSASGFGFAQPGVFEFWYRQSASPLGPKNPDNWGNASAWRITSTNPGNHYPGMTSVRLDTKGRLVELWSTAQSNQTVGTETDSLAEAVFAVTELPIAGYQLSEMEDPIKAAIAAIPHDRVYYWKAAATKSESEAVLATTLRGKLNYLSVIQSGEIGSLGRFVQAPPSTFGISGVLLSFIVIAAISLAAYNLYTTKVDLHGAAQCALLVFVCDLLGWTIMSGSVYDVVTNSHFAANYLIRTLALASRCGIFYLAAEPVIRRYYPTTAISLARLVEARYRDPLVARDILVGVMWGIGISVFFGLLSFALQQLLDIQHFDKEAFPDSPELIKLHYAVGYHLSALAYTFAMCLGGLSILVFMTKATRNRPISLLVFVAMCSTTADLDSWYSIATVWIMNSCAAWCYIRHGMIAAFFLWFSYFTAMIYPFTTHFEAWYSASGLFYCASIALIGAYGFYFSTIAPRASARKTLPRSSLR